jgi:hypothetical protein
VRRRARRARWRTAVWRPQRGRPRTIAFRYVLHSTPHNHDASPYRSAHSRFEISHSSCAARRWPHDVSETTAGVVSHRAFDSFGSTTTSDHLGHLSSSDVFSSNFESYWFAATTSRRARRCSSQKAAEAQTEEEQVDRREARVREGSTIVTWLFRNGSFLHDEQLMSIYDDI